MKRLRLLLLLMAVSASQMDAGRPQLPEPFDDPKGAWIETWNQVRRMVSMANRNEIGLEVRTQQVEGYMQDIKERLSRLDQNRIGGTTHLTVEDMQNLWKFAHPYTTYPVDPFVVDDALQEDKDDENAPLIPRDDDAPSFSDGDFGDDEAEEDLAVHVGQRDQEDDDFMDLE